jgi:hypothetical protein
MIWFIISAATFVLFLIFVAAATDWDRIAKNSPRSVDGSPLRWAWVPAVPFYFLAQWATKHGCVLQVPGGTSRVLWGIGAAVGLLIATLAWDRRVNQPVGTGGKAAHASDTLAQLAAAAVLAMSLLGGSLALCEIEDAPAVMLKASPTSQQGIRGGHLAFDKFQSAWDDVVMFRGGTITAGATSVKSEQATKASVRLGTSMSVSGVVAAFIAIGGIVLLIRRGVDIWSRRARGRHWIRVPLVLAGLGATAIPLLSGVAAYIGVTAAPGLIDQFAQAGAATGLALTLLCVLVPGKTPEVEFAKQT